MRLAPGTQLGAYEVLGDLGAGGMGEVYRARDTTLHREVAIKLVNPAYCGDPESMSRLRREARALAQLNHPHVATIHELAEFEGFCGLVMELVPGLTLAEMIAERRLVPHEVAGIGQQITAALEAAHERGVVHRDLKPANIKITPDGAVKVIDFGLAKAEDGKRDPADRSPLASMVTRTGVVTGTVSYMSPEQARGAATDRRTDIWALGCVLFEMLSGRRAFEGPTPSDTLVMILDRQPDWTLLPPTTPPALTRILRRCLEKDVRRRWRDAADVRIELEDLASPAVLPPDVAAPASWRMPNPIVAVLVVAAALAGAAAMMFARQPPPGADAPEIRFALPLASGERLGGLDFVALAISPDGRFVTYVAAQGAGTQLMLRRLNALDATPVAGATNATSPFFSPDSQWIGFFADGSLKKVAVTGGPPVTLCAADVGFGGSWAPDNTIVFSAATGSPLSRIAAAGGAVSRVTALDAARGEFSHRWPQVLADGDTVLYTVGTVGEWDEADIVAQSLRTGRREIVLKGGTHPHYLASGHLLYTHANGVWMVPFDVAQLRTTGPATRVLDGVTASSDGAAQFAVSRTGTALYFASESGAGSRRLRIAEGREETPLAAPPRAYSTPRLAPNGRQLLVSVVEPTEQIWLYDLSNDNSTQLTFEGANRDAIWMPDAAHVTFSSNRNGALNLFTTAVANPAAVERLTTSDHRQLPGSWSPDGRVLAFVEQRPDSGRDIWLLPRGGVPTRWADSPADESAPRFSPNGRWLAYVSTEAGAANVFVRAVTGGAPAQQVSPNGGIEPVWARDGGALFFRVDSRLMAVPVLDGASLRFGAVTPVLDASGEPGSLDAANYDVTTASGRFVVVAKASIEQPAGLRVIVNWNPAVAASP